MFEFPVVFVDVETTGGSARTGGIIEVAAIRYERGEVTESFQSLVNPGRDVPPAITSLTGISTADVAGAPAFDEIADQLYEVCDGAVFCAHNVTFDLSFVKKSLGECGYSFSPRVLCTVRLSRSLYPAAAGHSLQAVIERHAIVTDSRHRAYDDAEAALRFTQLAYAEHGPAAFTRAVDQQLRRQSLPPFIDGAELDAIGDMPGVYIFEDESGQAIYVGKSVRLRTRILSHFSAAARDGKELKLFQGVRRLRTIPTPSELEALLLESRLVKELLPVYNRTLRRTTSYALCVESAGPDGYKVIDIVSKGLSAPADMAGVCAVYANRSQAKERLDRLKRDHGLCGKLLGIEKARGGCFNYQLGRCRGACVGEEPPDAYNARLDAAFASTRLREWPYDGPVAVNITEDRAVVVDRWIIRGFLVQPASLDMVFEPAEHDFSLDTYKIIRQFLRAHLPAVFRLDARLQAMVV